MSEPSWPAPGIECICVNPHGWRDLRGEDWFILDCGPRPGPEFMQQYTISSLFLYEKDQPGHMLKLQFAEYPDEKYCACQFRPLAKIEDEITQDVTAPVDKVLT